MQNCVVIYHCYQSHLVRTLITATNWRTVNEFRRMSVSAFYIFVTVVTCNAIGQWALPKNRAEYIDFFISFFRKKEMYRKTGVNSHILLE